MIRAEKATLQAQYRLINIFIAELENELLPLNDLNNLIPIPESHSYFVAGSDAAMVQILNTENQAAFISPLAPSTITNRRTGDGLIRGIIMTTVFRVTFLFNKLAGWEQVIYNGKELSEMEFVYHQADRLRGAALVTVYKHAVNVDDIHEVEVTAQYADVVTTENNSLMGRAILDITVVQNVEVDMPRYQI